ncbi:inhibitor of growth protein 3-like [Nasonia vitripennis]|uniref:Zinc finger PHD-type domain-containing protein n=1 Tax=Nasonia vitripennis TaxID=7425 RepID=A0A7M7H9U2_NASVI|nr:inhibitor of growth protein 3-like [Nasonia vitripennis]
MTTVALNQNVTVKLVVPGQLADPVIRNYLMGKSASNKNLLSDCVSSVESSDNNHKTKNENSTSPSSDKKIIERNKLKKNKSSCSNYKRSVDVSDWALKKANRVKSSNDQKPSSESRCQKETKDAMKRRKSEKSSIINKISSQMDVKKRKVSMSSSEEEFDIPSDPNEPVYCYCQKVSYGDMVAYDNDNECEIVWFHFGCVGLKSIPIGKWFCTECSKKKRDTGKNVRRSC